MYLFTYNDLKTKLGNDCDITDERFISPTELLGYINEAIADAEAAIHNLNYEDKYFLKTDTLSLVNGTSLYDLPSDIYATKIRTVFYNNNVQKYEVMRIKNLRDTMYFESSDYYQYLLLNPTPGVVPKMKFFPAPIASETDTIERFYIREMQRMDTTDGATNVCEVYECQNFVFAHVRNSVAIKTRRPDLVAITADIVMKQYNLMLENLQQMVEDENNLVQMDLSFYNQGIDPYWGR